MKKKASFPQGSARTKVVLNSLKTLQMYYARLCWLFQDATNFFYSALTSTLEIEIISCKASASC